MAHRRSTTAYHPATLLKVNIETLRQGPKRTLGQSAPSGVRLQKLYEQIRSSPLLLRDYVTSMRELIETGEVTLYGHAKRFGNGTSYACDCRFSGDDIPPWFGFDSNQFCMTYQKERFDISVILTDRGFIPHHERVKFSYIQLYLLQVYLTEGGLPKVVEGAIERQLKPDSKQVRVMRP